MLNLIKLDLDATLVLGSTHIKTIQNITEEAKWKQKQDLYQNQTKNKKKTLAPGPGQR